MRLVAEVVDRFSGPMRDMQKSLRALSDSAKSTHQTNTAHVRDQAKAYAGLDQSVKQISDRTKSMLVPALAAAGVSILSVGAAVAAIVKATQSFGEATKKLSFMSRETGLTIAKLRELDELAKRVGTTPEAMRAGEQAFASNMEQLRRWRGASAEFFTSQHDLAVRALGDTLRMSRGNEDAFDSIEKFLEKVPDMQQRMNLLKAVGLPEELGRLTGPALRQAMHDIADDLGRLPANATAMGVALGVAMDRLGTTLSGTRDMIGASLAGPFAEATDATREWVKENRGELIGSLGDLATALKAVDWKTFGSDAEGLTKGALREVGKMVRDIATAVHEINSLRQGDLSSLSVRTIPGSPADWLVRGVVGPDAARRSRGDATFNERFAVPGFATGGIVTRDMLAAVHKGEVVIPAGGGSDTLKKPIKEGTEEGTRKGVLDGLRDWFDEPRSAGGGRGGGGGGRLAALGGGGAGEVPSAGGGLGSPHGGGGGSEDAPQTSGGGVRGSKSAVAGIVANEARAGGMSERGVAGLLGEVQSESGFNPNLRHADQPRFGGEAHYAHGLFQEGGTEWNHYAAWLKANHPGEDWRNPHRQTQFLMENLKKNYPATWARMNKAGSAADAAYAFRSGYLKPAAAFMNRGTSANWWAGHMPARESIGAVSDPSREFSVPRLDLLKQGKQSGLMGGGAQKVEGDARLSIDLNGFPRGTKTSTEFGGMFKEVALDRGRSMPLAS